MPSGEAYALKATDIARRVLLAELVKHGVAVMCALQKLPF
jgi:hypothetical protein